MQFERANCGCIHRGQGDEGLTFLDGGGGSDSGGGGGGEGGRGGNSMPHW